MADVFHDNNIIGNDVQTGLGYDYQKTSPHSACGRDEVLQMSTVTSSESDHQRDAVSKSIQQRKKTLLIPRRNTPVFCRVGLGRL